MERFGIQTLPAQFQLPYHVHRDGYVTVVLEGSYLESGDGGRCHVVPGAVLVHSEFDAHRNETAARPVRLLNLPLPSPVPGHAHYEIADPDLIARLSQADLRAASEQLFCLARPVLREIDDLPGVLAQHIRENPCFSLTRWARHYGISPSYAARQFRRAFGVTAAVYRKRARFHHARQMLERTEVPLADVAATAGYTDQPYFNRCFKAETGLSPMEWRRFRKLQYARISPP
ncbi:helix-turn-helix domain-containing protein [Glycocaulis sp.]|uniref:helix-turn-helix domain-containing protein n=1 Tax=Glycocaulis sp. TaxID=1969725 RepID=UPI003D1F1155